MPVVRLTLDLSRNSSTRTVELEFSEISDAMFQIGETEVGA
jgi:hypothetical protein